ncbi:MAG: hypothetical protein RIR26_2846 [Pseudomonadota bacterium]|jgi:pimeloyl-ACP methyl ester carboxylesterase
MDILNLDGVNIYRFKPETGLGTRSVLFSHATGIAALSYDGVLQRWANELQMNIFSYDARGHGESTLRVSVSEVAGRINIPALLCDDLKKIGEQLMALFPGPWTLAGHSLGGWLSLYTAADLNIDHVVLLDMPLLPPSSAFLWAAACLFQQRGFHPLSRPARRRKRLFKTRREAFVTFKKNPFFRKWDNAHIEHYIDANFATLSDGSIHLRHDPEWEASLFESQPALHTPLFLKMDAKKRKQVQVELIAGSESRICDPASIRYFYGFFPRTRWFVVPQGGHMFPFENTRGLMKVLSLAFPQNQNSLFDDMERQAV